MRTKIFMVILDHFLLNKLMVKWLGISYGVRNEILLSIHYLPASYSK